MRGPEGLKVRAVRSCLVSPQPRVRWCCLGVWGAWVANWVTTPQVATGLLWTSMDEIPASQSVPSDVR